MKSFFVFVRAPVGRLKLAGGCIAQNLRGLKQCALLLCCAGGAPSAALVYTFVQGRACICVDSAVKKKYYVGEANANMR